MNLEFEWQALSCHFHIFPCCFSFIPLCNLWSIHEGSANPVWPALICKIYLVLFEIIGCMELKWQELLSHSWRKKYFVIHIEILCYPHSLLRLLFIILSKANTMLWPCVTHVMFELIEFWSRITKPFFSNISNTESKVWYKYNFLNKWNE